MLNTFLYTCWLLYVIFGKISVDVPCPFLKFIYILLLSCLSSLYILILVSCQMVCKYFLTSHWFCFTLLIVSFALLVYFCFCCLFFRVISKKVTAKASVMEISPCGGSRDFRVSGLIFKLLIHFELIFYIV
jgi:hypothetical protein